MNRVTGDTGRALAVITGIPFSLIWVTINYVPLGLVSLAIWRFRCFRGDFDTVETHTSFVYGEEANLLAENPYHAPHANDPMGKD